MNYELAQALQIGTADEAQVSQGDHDRTHPPARMRPAEDERSIGYRPLLRVKRLQSSQTDGRAKGESDASILREKVKV